MPPKMPPKKTSPSVQVRVRILGGFRTIAINSTMSNHDSICQFFDDVSDNCFIRFRMSSAFHAVQRADNLTGFGYRPDFTPAHQQDLPIGITVNTSDNRIKPISGIVNCITNLPNKISDLRPMRFLPLMFRLSRVGRSTLDDFDLDGLDNGRVCVRRFLPFVGVEFLNEIGLPVFNGKHHFL